LSGAVQEEGASGMKIGVELRQLVPGASGGIVPHMEGVLNALFREHPEHEVVLFGVPRNEGMCPSLPPQVRRVTLAPERYYPEQDRLARALGIDVLFCTYPRRERTRFPMARQVVFIPDMQHESFPEFFSPGALAWRRECHNRALAEAGAIGTNSEHARQALRAQPAARCTDVFLMGPAADPPAPPLDLEELSAEEREGLPDRPFFLYPANLWPHKNHCRILQAFERLRAREPGPIEFVFTGHPEGWPELARDFAHLPVRHLGFVRRPFLRLLLRRAAALVFFSLYEGFGMPLLEAFQAGTPVVCSNTTSLPEVGGGAVLAADPADPAAMSEGMFRLLREPDLRARLIAAGTQRLARYTWEASARSLVDAFARVAARPAPARGLFPLGGAFLRFGFAPRTRA
jgi:glycosyltransferase involved in cell wall biosynthesis